MEYVSFISQYDIYLSGPIYLRTDISQDRSRSSLEFTGNYIPSPENLDFDYYYNSFKTAYIHILSLASTFYTAILSPITAGKWPPIVVEWGPKLTGGQGR